MTWLIFTMMSASLIKDVDHKQFKSYNSCTQYVEQLHSKERKTCMTNRAKFKHKKVKK